MRYVIGFTDNEAGRGALALGERLARRSGATVEIVSVLVDDSAGYFPPPDASYDEAVTSTAAEWLAVARASVDSAVPCTSKLVRSDSTTAALLAEAEPDARLLVVGALRSGLGTLFQGSVSSELLHSAAVPVAVAPAGTQEILRRTPVSRVTCFLGARPGAENLVDAAVSAARDLQVPLRIVSLVSVDEASGELPTGAVDRAQAHIDTVAAQARETLDDLTVTTETASGSDIEDAVRHTTWDPAEIALVGSSRLAGARRIFLGSVATKVARVLPVPLVVIPSASHD